MAARRGASRRPRFGRPRPGNRPGLRRGRAPGRDPRAGDDDPAAARPDRGGSSGRRAWWRLTAMPADRGGRAGERIRVDDDEIGGRPRVEIRLRSWLAAPGPIEICCSGCQGGRASRLRWTAAAIAIQGSSGATGASEPRASATPASMHRPVGERALGAPGPVPVGHVAVVDRVLGLHAGDRVRVVPFGRCRPAVISWACSMVQRWPGANRARSNASSAIEFAWSPIACTAAPRPACFGPVTAARASSLGLHREQAVRPSARCRRDRARSNTRSGCSASRR